jgi:hypothetical protein
LFYIAADGNLMSVELKGETLAPGAPKALFQTNLIVAPGADQYAATRDGKRFHIVKPLESEKLSSIAIVMNWFEELEKLLPAP